MQTQTSNTLRNAIMEAGSKDRPPMLAPGESLSIHISLSLLIQSKKKNDVKARTTLLLSLPDKHQLRFTKHSRGNDEVNTASVYTASSNVPTASANVVTVSISQEIACAYIASQSSGSQIKFKDINQIDVDDIEEMDIKWNMALLSIRADKFWKKTVKKISIQGSDVAGFNKSKVECFNCHKMGHFQENAKLPETKTEEGETTTDRGLKLKNRLQKH
nr:ribonuclease H-like domain-containing protein [Tanacetum cinerariifolium]